MAKPKPTGPIKAKASARSPVFQSSNQLSERSSSAKELSNPETPGTRRQTRLVSVISNRELLRDTCHAVKHSQARAQEKRSKCRILETDNEHFLYTAQVPRKKERTVDTTDKYGMPQHEDHNFPVSHEGLFNSCKQKLGIQKGHLTFGIEATKTNIFMWGLFMSSSMRAAIHLGVNQCKRIWKLSST